MSRRSSRYLLALLLLIGLLVMLACDWSIDHGINCVQTVDSKLIAVSYEDYNGIPQSPSGYYSTDGGLTWQAGWRDDPARPFELKCKHTMPAQLSDPHDEHVVYRFTAEGGVERSTDSGQTWQHELDAVLGEAEAAYYGKLRDPLATEPQSKPQDAIIDERTGNVVVALGLVGVAVRTTDGRWQHVSIGPYVYYPLDSGKIFLLLNGELLLALAVVFLIAETSFLLATGKRWWTVVVGILLWLLWVLGLFLAFVSNSLFISMVVSDSLLEQLFLLLVLGAALWSIHALYQLSRITWRAVFIAGIGGLIGGLLFYAMYWWWAWVKIPTYGLASLYAVLLVIATIIATAYFINREVDRATMNQSQQELEVDIDDTTNNQSNG
ncbi:MAG TPA: hypothetical protein VMP08_21115 [Anaerolineae bacterium]|nr:hypothetical protein [Anaerolineae bacterium]